MPLEPADAAAPGSGLEAPAPSATGYATVCGVTVEGKEYRYRCTVEGDAPGSTGTTALHFPDNDVTIAWHGGGKATATFAGMVPMDITIATEDGVTRFPFEDKVLLRPTARRAAAEAQDAALTAFFIVSARPSQGRRQHRSAAPHQRHGASGPWRRERPHDQLPAPVLHRQRNGRQQRDAAAHARHLHERRQARRAIVRLRCPCAGTELQRLIPEAVPIVQRLVALAV
ncbi:MAG: hypothetical protein R2712_11350 [Vicinamibacterales bacterium]